MIFYDRKEAGKKLAIALESHLGAENTVVLGLARGGVVVAAEVAKELGLPWDVIVVQKVGAPDNEELALGAISSEGKGEFNDHLITLLGVSKEYLKKEIEKKKEKAKEREKQYLKGRLPLNLSNQTVLLVDDGIATGASMRAAIASARRKQASKVILAVPVAAPESLAKMKELVDEVVCLSTPSFFQAVGAFYKNFEPTTDEEIVLLLGLRIVN